MTWRAERSGPRTGLPSSSTSGLPRSSIWGTPALRKYFDTMMSVATCDQAAGISASFISNTTEPSGLLIRLVRRLHSTESNGSWPSVVKRRSIVRPRVSLEVLPAVFVATVIAFPSCPVSPPQPGTDLST